MGGHSKQLVAVGVLLTWFLIPLLLCLSQLSQGLCASATLHDFRNNEMKIKCACSLSYPCPFAVLHPARTQLRGWLVPAAVPLFASGVHRLQADSHACSVAHSNYQWPRYFSCCKEMKPGSTRGQGQGLIL